MESTKNSFVALNMMCSTFTPTMDSHLRILGMAFGYQLWVFILRMV